MKNNFTRTLLSLVALFSTTVLYAFDFEAVNEDGVTIYYNIISTTDRTCEVTSGNGYSGIVKIPETVSYSSLVFKVTSIGKEAFDNCKGLTSIEIPNSVTSIGRSAFRSCCFRERAAPHHGCYGRTSGPGHGAGARSRRG